MSLQRPELFVRDHRSFPDFRIIGLETIEAERKGHDQGNGEDNPEPSRMECLLNIISRTAQDNCRCDTSHVSRPDSGRCGDHQSLKI